MAKLYELTNEYANLLEMLESGNDDIPAEVLHDTLESLGGELRSKALEISVIIKDIEADIVSFKAEEEKLSKRRHNLENSVKSMKEYLARELAVAGISEIKGDPRARISFRRSWQVNIEDEASFTAWAEANNRDDLLSFKTMVSKTAVKQAIDSGDALPGATLIEKNSIQIK